MKNPSAQPQAGSANDVVAAETPPDLTLEHASRLAVLAVDQVLQAAPLFSLRSLFPSGPNQGLPVNLEREVRDEPEPAICFIGLVDQYQVRTEPDLAHPDT